MAETDLLLRGFIVLSPNRFYRDVTLERDKRIIGMIDTKYQVLLYSVSVSKTYRRTQTGSGGNRSRMGKGVRPEWRLRASIRANGGERATNTNGTSRERMT